jgi:hypothetical protein
VENFNGLLRILRVNLFKVKAILFLEGIFVIIDLIRSDLKKDLIRPCAVVRFALFSFMLINPNIYAQHVVHIRVPS